MHQHISAIAKELGGPDINIRASTRWPVIESFLKKIDGQSATEMLDKYRFGDNRRIIQAKVEQYRKAMEDGGFAELSTITFGKPVGSDKLILVNGHHRLSALSGQDMTMPFRIDVREVSDADDALDLYLCFTEKEKSNGDIVRMTTMANGCGVSATRLARWMRAWNWIEEGFPLRPSSVAQGRMIEVISGWIPQAVEIAEIVKCKPYGKFLDTLAGISAMSITFRYSDLTGVKTTNGESVTPKLFWEAVAKNVRSDDMDVRKATSEYLAKRAGDKKQRASGTLYCLGHAWSIWVCGQKLPQIRNNNSATTVATFALCGDDFCRFVVGRSANE